MENAIPILMRVVLAFGLAVLGGGLSAVVGFSHERLCALISLAAGTLLGVTVFAIIPETALTLHWWELAVALGSGYILFQLISRYVYHVCPACAASHFDEATTHRFSEIASALIIALAIHSTLDGVALAAGHEVQHGHGHLAGHGTGLDLGLVVAVCVHKFPEGLALGALLLGAGYTRPRMLVWVTAVEATTVLGGVIGLVAIPGGLTAARQGFWLAAILAHVGGGFLFLAAHAVLGEMVKHGKKVVLASFGAGVVLIALLKIGLRLL